MIYERCYKPATKRAIHFIVDGSNLWRLVHLFFQLPGQRFPQGRMRFDEANDVAQVLYPLALAALRGIPSHDFSGKRVFK